ncbi:tripartite tricarboxylate transporter TctB family protein, partial [Thermodesulfobacteriota bacterium]
MKFNMKSLVTLFLIVIFGIFVFKIKDFSFGGRLLPLVVGIPALILCVLQLIMDLRENAKKEKVINYNINASIVSEGSNIKAAKFFSWLIGFYIFIWVIGFKISTILFTIGFMRIEGKSKWSAVVFLTMMTMFSIFCFEYLLSLTWPEPLLKELFKSSLIF